jgi:hypothetical protein
VHKVKIGMQKSRTIDVSCGGTLGLEQVSPFELPPPPEKRTYKLGHTGRLHGGVAMRRFLGDNVIGADLGVSLGGYVDNVNIYGDLQMFFGSTEGLPLRQYKIGPSLDVEPISRLRLGLGLSLGGTTVTSADGDTTRSAFSAGARIFVSFDIVKIDERAGFYVLGQLSGDSTGALFPDDDRGHVPEGTIWGPSIAVGGRY